MSLPRLWNAAVTTVVRGVPLRVLRYKAADWLVLVAFLALTAGIIVLKKLGF